MGETRQDGGVGGGNNLNLKLDSAAQNFSNDPPIFFDLSNPQHFINLVTEETKNTILSVPHRYWEMTEAKLIQEVYGDEPDEIDQCLRIEFWEEYDRCFLKCWDIKPE